MSDYHSGYDNRGDHRGDSRGGGRGRGRGRGRGGDRHDRGGDRGGMPLSDLDPALTEVSRRVIGCAIETHKALGPGYPKEVYAKALAAELSREEISHAQGHELEVVYRGEKVGSVRTDLFVNDRFVVAVEAHTGEVSSGERSALRAQLRAADVELGLIINFGERRLKDGLVRVLNPDKLNALRAEHDDEQGDEHDDEDDDEYEDEDEDGDEYEDDDEDEDDDEL